MHVDSSVGAHYKLVQSSEWYTPTSPAYHLLGFLCFELEWSQVSVSSVKIWVVDVVFEDYTGGNRSPLANYT